MNTWSWAFSSCIGTSHLKKNDRKQDAYLTQSFNDDSVINLIICDGAGSSLYGGQGASIVCRVLGKSARAHWKLNKKLPSFDEISSWIEIARNNILNAAHNKNVETREFATTLIFALSDGSESVFAQIGDGCCVFKNEETGSWCHAIWPNHGEYASTTYFVTDNPDYKLRVCHTSYPIASLILFSDGIERLALDFKRKEPFEGFLNPLLAPILDDTVKGKNINLSKKLKLFLESDRINERTDDDKTLIIAAKK